MQTVVIELTPKLHDGLLYAAIFIALGLFAIAWALDRVADAIKGHGRK